MKNLKDHFEVNTNLSWEHKVALNVIQMRMAEAVEMVWRLKAKQMARDLVGLWEKTKHKKA